MSKTDLDSITAARGKTGKEQEIDWEDTDGDGPTFALSHLFGNVSTPLGWLALTPNENDLPFVVIGNWGRRVYLGLGR